MSFVSLKGCAEIKRRYSLTYRLNLLSVKNGANDLPTSKIFTYNVSDTNTVLFGHLKNMQINSEHD